MSAALKCLVSRKIARSPTDLISLLAKTVSSVEASGVNNYAFVDDPFLLPSNVSERRSYALSKVSGERAARFVVNKFPFAFFLHKSFPEIPSYDPDYPSPNTAQLADPTVDHLVTLLSHGKAGDAFNVYKALKSVHHEIDMNIRLTLLECLSAIRDVEWYEPSAEEKWYIRDVHIKPWEQEDSAAELFDDMKDELALDSRSRVRAVSAMINGYAQSGSHRRSIELYEQLNSELPCKFTMCNVIRSASCLPAKDALPLIRHVLEKNSSIRPDSTIFSAIFYALDQLASKSKRQHSELLHSAVDCLAEMKQLKICHSLGTLANLTKLLRHTNYTAEFPQIIHWAEQLEDLTVREPDDCCFFMEAMDMCFKLDRYDLARTLNGILNKREQQISPMFLNGGQMNRFYERLLRLAVKSCEDSAEVESLWASLVPTVFSPSDELFLCFVDFLKNFQLLSIPEKNWPLRLFEVICSTKSYRRSLASISKLFYALRDEDPEVGGRVAAAAVTLLTEDERLENISLHAEVFLSDLAYILAVSKQLESALTVLEKWSDVVFDKSSLDAILALYLESEPERRTLAAAHRILKAYAKLGSQEFREAIERILGVMSLSRKQQRDLLLLCPKEENPQD